jgi:hypothetical protein
MQTETEWMKFTNILTDQIIITTELDWGDIQGDDYYSVKVYQAITYDIYTIIDQCNELMVQYKAPVHGNLWQFQYLSYVQSTSTNFVTLSNDSPSVTYVVWSDSNTSVKINNVLVSVAAHSRTIKIFPYRKFANIQYGQNFSSNKSVSIDYVDAFVSIEFDANVSSEPTIVVAPPEFRCVYTDLAGTQNLTSYKTALQYDNTLPCDHPFTIDKSGEQNYLLSYLFTGVIKCSGTCNVNVNDYFIYPPTPILLAELGTIEPPTNTEINENETIQFKGTFDTSEYANYYCEYIIGNTVIDLQPDIPHAATGIDGDGTYAHLLDCNTTGIVPFNTCSAGQQIDVNVWQIVNNEQNEPIRSKIISIPFVYEPIDHQLSKGALIGIIIGVIVGAILIVGSLVVYCRGRSESDSTAAAFATDHESDRAQYISIPIKSY